MTINNLHPKVQELKLRAAPVTYSNASVGEDGKLQFDEESSTVKGYLIVWGVRDTYGTKWVKGSFAQSLKTRGPQSNAKYKITFLYMHDQRDPIGQFTVLKEDDYGLYFEAALDTEIEEVPNARRAAGQIKKGTLNQFSIGFDYIWDKIEYDEQDDSLVIIECELYEGSVVTRGSCHETYAMRSPEDYTLAKDELDNDTEDIIRSLPRNKQLEIRQLITRHISLTAAKPQPRIPNQEERSALVLELEPDEAEKPLDYSSLIIID